MQTAHRGESETLAIYVINLEYRRDRRLAVERELDRVGWSAEFFPAVRPAEPLGFPSIGARGCFLSHLAVLKRGLGSGKDRIVILEDDVNLKEDFQRHWTSLEESLKQREWSILYPAHTLNMQQSGLTRLAPSDAVCLTHFMMFHRSSIAKIIEGLSAMLSRSAGDPVGGPMHVDGAYSTLRYQDNKLITYVFEPSLAYQRSSRTDIGETKWFDRFSAIAPAVEIARKLKRRLQRS